MRRWLQLVCLFFAASALGYAPEPNHFIQFAAANRLANTATPLGRQTWQLWNDRGLLYALRDPRSRWTTNFYDARVRRTNVTDALGVRLYSFDANNNGRMAFGEDSYGQINSISYPGNLGGESFGNNARGDVTNHVNARGFATVFQYNNRRELTNTIAPTNVMFSVVVDAVGNVQSTTDARTNMTSRTWSVTRHLLTTTLPPTAAGTAVLGNAYDVRDWLLRTTNALTKTTLLTNDLAGRQLSLTDPLRRTTCFGRDGDGRLTNTTDSAIETTTLTLTPRGEVSRILDAATHTVGQTLDPVGNPAFLTNRNAKVWQFVSDGANRVTATISPLRRTNSIVFNDRGLPFITRQPSGNSATCYYDGLKRLTNYSDSVASTLTTLDANGNPLLIANAGQPGALAFGWNAYDGMSSFTNADGYVVGWQRDKNGNPTVITYPGNRSVTNTFDTCNRLTQVVDWLGHLTVIGRDLAGQVIKITRPNNTVRLINRDDDGEITNIVEKTLSK